jgi:RNA polymerase-binding protein DksA
MSTQIDINHFRERLLDERKRVQDAIDYLHRDNSGAIEDVTADFTSGADNHLADTATETVDREIDYTLEENSERVLAEIDAALKRIEDGTFGTCTACGKQIEPERLEHLPYATLCIDDKRREERG